MTILQEQDDVPPGFAGEIQAFLTSHWPESAARDRYGSPPADDPPPVVRRWQQALLQRGWSVPDWPLAWGGPDWTWRQRLHWQFETGRAGVPDEHAFAVEVLGPLLLAAGEPDQQAAWLPRWRVGEALTLPALLEPDVPGLPFGRLTRAGPGAGAYTLIGEKLTPPCRYRPRWLAVLAVAAPEERLGLFLLDARTPGVSLRPVALLGGHNRLWRVSLDAVVVSAANRVAPALAESELLRWLFTPACRGVHQLGGIRRMLDDLAELLAPETEAAAWGRALPESRLTALEQRYTGLAALAERLHRLPRNSTASRHLAMNLAISTAALWQEIGSVPADIFGYHALPYPDPRLSHNEGAVGDPAARAQIAAALAAQAAGWNQGLTDWYRSELIAAAGLTTIEPPD